MQILLWASVALIFNKHHLLWKVYPLQYTSKKKKEAVSFPIFKTVLMTVCMVPYTDMVWDCLNQQQYRKAMQKRIWILVCISCSSSHVDKCSSTVSWRLKKKTNKKYHRKAYWKEYCIWATQSQYFHLYSTALRWSAESSLAFQRRQVSTRKVPEQNDQQDLRVENSMFSLARRKARTNVAAIFKYRSTAKKNFLISTEADKAVRN